MAARASSSLAALALGGVVGVAVLAYAYLSSSNNSGANQLRAPPLNQQGAFVLMVSFNRKTVEHEMTQQ